MANHSDAFVLQKITDTLMKWIMFMLFDQVMKKMKNLYELRLLEEKKMKERKSFHSYRIDIAHL